MPTRVKKAENPLFEICELLAAAAGCSGGCTYLWDQSTSSYNYVSGRCSGGAGCAGCPANFGPEIRVLVEGLPGFFPDSNTITLNCSMITMVPGVLKKLERCMKLHERASKKRKVKS